MACEANFDHEQGHDSNMEGPLRLLVPTSSGGPGICRSESGRQCSRYEYEKCDVCVIDNGSIEHDRHLAGRIYVNYGDELLDHGTGSMANVADQCDASFDRVDDLKHYGKACFADKYDCNFNGDGQLWKRYGTHGDGHLLDVNMVLPCDDIALASNGVDGLGYKPRAFINRGNDYNAERGGDPKQVGLVENLHVVSPISVMENQNRQTVMDSARVAQQLKDAIERANYMLQTKNCAGLQIPDKLVLEMELHLTNSICFLAEEVEQQDVVIAQLVGTRTSLEGEVVQLTDEKQELVNKLAIKKASSKFELRGVELRQLELWGIKDIHELFGKYQNLLVKVKSFEKQRSYISKSSSKASTALSRNGSSNTLAHTCPSEIKNFVEFGNEVVKSDYSSQDTEAKLKTGHGLRKASFPKPQAFKGKTRIELERFFRYFEPYANSLSLGDNEKALMIGYYLPNLQYHHDSLMQRKASYTEVKRELLNALGSDSSVAIYSIRASLDKLTKPVNKPYRKFFEEIERKVAEAYGSDQGQRERELKKILIRLTQEDADSSFSSTIIPHTTNDYYRLKELVLGTEDAIKLRMQNNRKLLASKSFESPGKHCEDIGTPRKMHDNNWQQKQNGDLHRQSISPDVSPTKSCASSSSSSKHEHVVLHCCHRPIFGYTRKCYACRKPDHVIKDCRKAGNTQLVHERSKFKYSDEVDNDFMISGITPVNTICESSLSEEYGANSGPHRKRRPCFKGVKQKSRKACFVCGKETHLARECSLRYGAPKVQKSNEEITPEIAVEEKCFVGAIQEMENARIYADKVSPNATSDAGKNSILSGSKAKKSLALTQEPSANSRKDCIERKRRGQSLVNVSRSKCNSADYQQPSEEFYQREKPVAKNHQKNCSLLNHALLCIHANVTTATHGENTQSHQQSRTQIQKTNELRATPRINRDLQSTCKWKKTHLNACSQSEYRNRASVKSNMQSGSRRLKEESLHFYQKANMKCNNYGRAECLYQRETQIIKKSIPYRGR